MLHHAGKRIKDYEDASHCNTAYTTAATIDKCQSGFECSGIYQLNRHRIPEFRYAAFMTTDNTVENTAKSEAEEKY